MEGPRVGRNDLVAVSVATHVSPFVNRNGDRFGTQRWNALQILLVVLIFGTYLYSGRALPFDQRKRRIDRHLLLQLHVCMLCTRSIVVLTDHVDVVETIEEHLAGPVGCR